MSISQVAPATPSARLTRPAWLVLGGRRTDRAVIAALVLVAGVAGFAATDTHDAAHAAALAGPDLVRLLRAMAAIKAVMAMAAIGAVLWRLAVPTGAARLVGYGAACTAMAVGPGLIWDMAHVGAGALLLHGGLAGAIILLWRDPGTSAMLEAVLHQKKRRFFFEKKNQKTLVN